MSINNLSVRLEEPGSEDRIAAVVSSAFQDEKVALLLDALRRSSAWRGLSFVGLVGDEIVAHLAFTRGWLDMPTKLVEVLILSPMSVTPEWQRRGIGSALILESIQLLADRPEPAVFLEGNPRFYSRLGFLPGREAGFTAPSVRIPDAAFQFIPLPAFDPSLTGALVYPDVFWEMDSVGLRA